MTSDHALAMAQATINILIEDICKIKSAADAMSRETLGQHTDLCRQWAEISVSADLATSGVERAQKYLRGVILPGQRIVCKNGEIWG
jgi:hypothetical protein